MTLLVMAAGMGSRYGGLKQLDPVGPGGEFILDYTVYDALRAGFNEVVFVIKEENLNLFRETVGNRIGKKIKTTYVFQSLDDLPEGFDVPEGRQKQWGTAHAVLAARNTIKGAFCAVNADDFYGSESFRLVADHLKQGGNACCMAGFILKNTLTENGTVSRGECALTEDGYLADVTERTKIKRDEKGQTVYFEDEDWHEIDENTIVSMNCWGLPAEFFGYAAESFREFLESGGDMLKKEFYLPDAVKKYLAASGNRAKVITTPSKWFGVTYKEDRAAVTANIKSAIEKGIYPGELWK